MMTSARAILAMGLMLLSNAPAFAQLAEPYRPERPYRGLFGPAVSNDEQRLSASGHAGGGYDDNVLLDQPGGTNPQAARAGAVGSLDGSLVYTMNKTKFGLVASGASSIRYYPSLEVRDHIVGHSGTVGMSAQITPRTLLTANGVVAYQPYSLTDVFAALTNRVTITEPLQSTLADPAFAQTFYPPDIDVSSTAASYLSVSGGVGLSHRFSRRVTGILSYAAESSETAYANQRFDHQGGYAGLSYSLNRSFGLRAGYGYQEGSYAIGGRHLHTQTIDAGVDFNRALSFSRRTTLQFSTGTTALSDAQDTTTYQLTGAARLAHEIGRTWEAGVAYARSYQFVDTLLQPVFYDSVNATYGGLVNRRVQLETGLRGSIGHVGSEQLSANTFDTYQASAALTFALTRHVNLGTDYSFYRYRYGHAIILPPGIPHDVDRQSIRGYVSLWAPLFTRSRRDHAPR